MHSCEDSYIFGWVCIEQPFFLKNKGLENKTFAKISILGAENLVKIEGIHHEM